MDLALLCRTHIWTRHLAFCLRSEQMSYVRNKHSFCTPKCLSYIHKSYAFVSYILTSRNLNCETRCGQTAVIAVRLHSYARSKPRERKKFNSEATAMPANTDAHNIPVGFGISPRSEKYKALNGRRDTNNESFHSSPEPRESESAGSDDTPTRGGTDCWR